MTRRLLWGLIPSALFGAGRKSRGKKAEIDDAEEVMKAAEAYAKLQSETLSANGVEERVSEYVRVHAIYAFTQGVMWERDRRRHQE